MIATKMQHGRCVRKNTAAISFVKLMNGEIEVESTEWKGSRFIVKLPIAKKSDEKLVSNQITAPLQKS